MKVPLLDLKEQNDALRPEIEAALGRVLDTNGFILGGEVAELECELAGYCGTKYAIGCASGSDAILLALMALDVGPGDEVITTPYSFFATVSAITRLGATAVFVDIDPVTYNLDVKQVEARITAQTKAITFGISAMFVGVAGALHAIIFEFVSPDSFRFELSIAILVLFTGLIVRHLIEGRRPDCACFGAWSSKPIGPGHLLRNTAFLALAVLALWA